MDWQPTFDQLAEVLADGVACLDADGRYRFVNDVIATSWDLSPDEFVGRRPAEVGLPADECAFLDDVVAAALGSEEPVEIEVDLQPTRPGRSGRVIRARAQAHRHDGETLVLVVQHDASDEARLDDAIGRDREELRRQRELYEALVATASEGIWIVDADFRVLFVNGRFAEMLGYEPDELIGTSALDLLHDPATRILDADGQPVLPPTGNIGRRVLQNRDGTPVEVERVVSLLRDEDGTVIGAIGMVTDLRPLQEAEARERIVEASLRTIAELAPIGIADANLDGTDVFHNRRLEELHGRVYEGVREPDRINFVHPDDRDLVTGTWARAAAGEHPPPVRYRAIADDGTTRWIEMQMVPVLGADGKTARIIETFVDADRAVAAEARLEVDLDQARLESEAKTRFLTRMSHELRTPLNGIIGLASALGDDEERPDRRELLNAIQRSGDRLLTVLGDVIDLAELEVGRLRLTTTAFDPFALADAAVERRRDEVARRGRTLRSEHPAVSPALLGDETRLARLVDHLVLHTLDHGDGDGEGIVVRVRVDPVDEEAGTARLSIVVGPAELVDLDPAAEPPSDADDELEVTLSVSWALVLRMGGNLGLIDRTGVGRAVSVEIPLMLADRTPAGSQHADRVANMADGLPTTVLLVEDDEVNRTVARSILARLGLIVDAATDGMQALRMASAKDYAAILMDRRIPRIDGLEVTRRIRAGSGPNRDTPILALTASTMSGDREQCLAAGMDAFLSKPFTMRQLAAAIAALGVPVVEPSSAERPLLDARRVDELAAWGGTLLDDLRSVFGETARALVEEVRVALADGHLEDAAFVARELAGTCGAVGAIRCAEMASTVANRCDAADAASAAPVLDELLDDLARTEEALRLAPV